MAGERSGLEALELTGEEAERLRRAFQDEGFRRLFAEYAAELADPAQRAVYEAEVAALERQRGVEARFLHPTPGWVLRTSQAGARRCYLNVCSHALVGRPEARPEPGGGSSWALPHCLSPGREELGRAAGEPRRRLVYDVLFHPDALRLAARSPRFRRLLDQTALEAVERQFAPGLDLANAVPLRGAKYKGVPQASLLRTPLPGGGGRGGGEEEEGGSPLPPFPTPYAYPPPPPQHYEAPRPEPAAPAAATPRWTLRQRCYVDLQDYRCSRDSAPSPVPRELEVTVELPLLSSAAQAQLEVRGQELQLDSRRPAAYRLRLRLPYPVDEDGGRATFDKSKRRLVVTLPVLRPAPACPGRPGGGEEEEEEKEAPGSGDSSPPLEPPQGPCAVPENRLPEQPWPATHVGTNHVELPVCAQESGPVAVGTSGRPGESAVSCPARLDVPLGTTPELRGDAETGDRVASDAARCSIEASACDRSPGPGAPEDATCARGNACHGFDCVILAPEVCVGSGVGLPACPGITGPVVTQVGLGTDMDRRQCPQVASTVPSPELEEATVPSAPRCGVGSDPPVTTEHHQCSDPDQNVETCTRTNGSRCPGSCDGPVVPVCSPSAKLSVAAASGASSPPLLLSMAGLAIDPEPALSPSISPVSPSPPSSSTPPLCPPFQCTQDEEALMLLLQVPGIVPQSLKGEVGTHHYRVSFASKDSVSYSLLLRLPAENKLTSPETSISVSLANAVTHLTKAPDTTGLWTKLYFGLNEDAVQEKFFVTEDNVAGFLDSPQQPSHPGQPKTERQPLIEVLEVSEGQSRIRLKAHNSPEAGLAEEKVDPGTEDGKHPFGAENRPVVPEPAGEDSIQPRKAPDSLAAATTREPAGWGQGHCVQADPADSGSAPPGKSQRTKLQESELAAAADSRATEQTPLEHAKTGEEVRSQLTESGSPPAPVLRETDTRDGSVQLISQHTTRCAFTFQNPLLYELD